MDTKNVLLELRTKNGLTQEELAEKVFVTRQAVSRWETGVWYPDVTLFPIIAELFGVPIGVLFGEKKKE